MTMPDSLGLEKYKSLMKSAHAMQQTGSHDLAKNAQRRAMESLAGWRAYKEQEQEPTMGTDHTVKINDTYSHVEHTDGTCRIMRKGKPWRDVTGDDLMAMVIEELGAAQKASKDGEASQHLRDEVARLQVKIGKMRQIERQHQADAKRTQEEHDALRIKLRARDSERVQMARIIRKNADKERKKTATDNRNDRLQRLLREVRNSNEALRATKADIEHQLSISREESRRLRERLAHYAQHNPFAKDA